MAHDVGRDFGRGRGGEREHRHVRAYYASQGCYTQVGGAEVIAPLRYAVGLVDHEQRDGECAQFGEKMFILKAFG